VFKGADFFKPECVGVEEVETELLNLGCAWFEVAFELRAGVGFDEDAEAYGKCDTLHRCVTVFGRRVRILMIRPCPSIRPPTCRCFTPTCAKASGRRRGLGGQFLPEGLQGYFGAFFGRAIDCAYYG
jgi:hypothetical protein